MLWVVARSTDWWQGFYFFSLRNLVWLKIAFSLKRVGQEGEEGRGSGSGCAIRCCNTSLKLGFWGELLKNFALWRANPQEKATSPAWDCRADFVPSVWTLHKLRVAWAGGRVRSMYGAGPFSIPNAGQLSSALTWAEKWLFMFWVSALWKLRIPGQVTG